MPDNKPKKQNDYFYNETLKNFKAGLMAETGGTADYSIVNNSGKKPTKATGKYQFLPGVWEKQVRAFASKNGYEWKDWESSFKGNAELQEHFFQNYYDTVVWPEVKRAKNSGELEKSKLSMDEYAYAVHFDGVNGGKRFLNPNYVRKSDDYGNPDSTKVFKNYKNYREKFGGVPVYGHTKEDLEKKLNEYDKEIESINANDNFSDELKAAKVINVNKKYQNQGYILPNTSDGKPQGFNLIIEERNKAKEEKVNDLVSLTKKNLNVNYDIKKDAKGNEIQVLNKKQDKRLPYSNSSYYSKTYAGLDLTKEEYDKLKKKYPNLVTKNNNLSQIDGDYLVNLEELDDNLFKETGVKLFNEVQFNRGNHKTTQFIRNKNQKIDVNVSSTLKNKFGATTNLGGVFSFGEVNIPSNKLTRSTLGYIQDLEEATDTTPEETTPTVDTADATAKEIEAAKRMSMEKKEVPTTLATDDFFRNPDEVPQGVVSDEFKDNFPWAQVLGNAAGAFTGIAMADKKIPMRDEQVSDAFRDYAAKIKKLSEIGLRPEEEAYAKRMITESYTGSIDQLVKASGGARNLVLGNLGRVDAQKNKSLIELAVADASAKTDALHKYGEAMQYINEFDARRDIANNERKYKDVLMTKEAGAQLAQAGFAGVIDTLNEYRDNKPGSINHLRRSYFYREHFGYDPQLKDDGTGNTKYTFSWFKKQNENLAKKAVEFNEVRDIYWKLDEDGRKKMNDFMLKNNFESYKDFAKTTYQRQVDSENGDGILLTPEQLADDSSGYADPNYVGPDGKKATKTSYSSVLNEADNGIKVNDNGIITSEKVSPSYLGDPRYDQEMLKKYPPEQAYQDILNQSKNGTLNEELPTQEEFTKDYIKQFEFAVDSKIRPAETKALETNPIDGNVYTGARAVLGGQETETPAQKLERLNREAEEYLKKDKSSNTLDLLINDTVKQTEELIKSTQK